MTKKPSKLPAGLPIEDSVIKNDDPRTMSIEEARAQVWAKEAQLAAQEAVHVAMAGGVGITKVTFSDEEGIKVEHMSHAEFLEGDSYGSAAAMTRDVELLDRRFGGAPNWAVNTPDPHEPWPDPRPEPASDAHGMDFGDAIRCLKRGQRVQRAGWNGRVGKFLRFLNAEEAAPLEPFVAVFKAYGDPSVWGPNQADVLADDWRVVG